MKMERMERIPVSVDHKPVYDIVMSNSFEGLRKELEPLGVSQKRVCIVTDSNVAPLYIRGGQGSNLPMRQAGWIIL